MQSFSRPEQHEALGYTPTSDERQVPYATSGLAFGFYWDLALLGEDPSFSRLAAVPHPAPPSNPLMTMLALRLLHYAARPSRLLCLSTHKILSCQYIPLLGKR
jgi:hypothetical protein